MLIATHAMHATLTVPFVPVGWQQVADSSFGTTNINAVASSGAGQFVAVGSSGKLATSTNIIGPPADGPGDRAFHPGKSKVGRFP